MKIMIVVHSSMFDACIPLINRLKDNTDLTCVFEVYPSSPNMMGVDETVFKNQDYVNGIEVPSLKQYADDIPLDKTTVIRFYQPSKIFRHIRMMYLLNKQIKKQKPDIVYFYNVDSIALLFAYTTKRNWAMAVHDPILHSSEKNAKFSQFIRRLLFYKCENYFLFTKNYLDAFSQKYHIFTNKIRLTALGAYEQVGVTHIIEEHNELNLLFFGRIVPYKGLRFLLESFKRLREKYNDINLYILGKGDIETDIINLNSAGLNIINRFYSVEEFREIISKCDLVVCPYTDATQSGVIMSSYAFRKPVLATNVGGLSEMVNHMKTGYLIESHESQMIYNAIDYIYHHKYLLNEWSAEIEKEYGEDGIRGWKNIANTLIKDFNDIIIKR